MKIIMRYLVATTLFISFMTNCSKQMDTRDDTFFKEQTTSEMQMAIVGSWQLVDKSGEMDDTHICSYNGIKWGNSAGDEKRDFKQNSDYSHFVKSTLTCQGSYKFSDNSTLNMNMNCQNYSEKIVDLTATFLTVKVGNRYYKYRKLN